MRSSYGALIRLADQRRAEDQPKPNRAAMRALERFGRERLSKHFFMRDFLYSEIAAVHGIPNVPDDPELALEAGRGLCRDLLEPLHEIFGHVTVRSAFRCGDLNGFGNAHGFSCANNRTARTRHIWDRHDDERHVGATACVVIPWFIDSEGYRNTGDWRPLAWFIHDHLPYSEMAFFPINAAFNLTWRVRDPIRKIRSYAPPKGILTRPGYPNHAGDHSDLYPGFPTV